MNPIPTGDDSPASFRDLALQQEGKPYVTAKVQRDSEAAFALSQRKFVRAFFGIPNRKATWSRKRYLKWKRRERVHAKVTFTELEPITVIVAPQGNVFRQAMLAHRGITTNS